VLQSAARVSGASGERDHPGQPQARRLLLLPCYVRCVNVGRELLLICFSSYYYSSATVSVCDVCCFLADLASFDPPVMKGLEELLSVSLHFDLQLISVSFACTYYLGH
jgi:hypothetical protein